MPLNRQAFEALARALGEQHVSEDPATLLSYTFSPFGYHVESGKVCPVGPEAVALPGSTEEVQALVRICNQHGVKYKAFSTGWGPWAMAGMKNVVTVDLRRMNQIVEIDEKNMCAVIEPYVTAGLLQAELMKRGLDCQIVSAGPTHSPLASATAYYGMGPKGATTGYNERNVLSVEWVLPTGDLLKIGSAGSGCGWFSGDGPGPGLRGIMRGYAGTCGGLGIFTRMGFKLYPWPGPEQLATAGESPLYRAREVPANLKFYLPWWQDWDDFTRAMYELSHASIAYVVSRQPPDSIGHYLTRSNNEFYELYQKNALPINREQRRCLSIVLASKTARELEYKVRVFHDILAATRGELIALTPDQEQLLLLAQLKLTYLPRVFRPTGDFASSFGIEESISMIPRVTQAGEEELGRFVRAGRILDEGKEGFWGWLTEQGRYVHWENAYGFDPRDLDSRRANMEYVLAANERVTKDGAMGMVMLPNFCGPFADIYGPTAGGQVQQWMRRVKNAFDPNNSSDHSWYISPEPEELPPQLRGLGK